MAEWSPEPMDRHAPRIPVTQTFYVTTPTADKHEDFHKITEHSF